MIDLGLGETDISLSLDTLYAENRKIVDPIANRYFFVWNPVELEVEGAEPKVAKAPLHPSRGPNPERSRQEQKCLSARAMWKT